MDKKLLFTACFLLILESTILFVDMGLIPSSLWQPEAPSTVEVGELLETKEQVRRKKNLSLLWENSVKQDKLFAYDSILTLENSSAQINLYNDVKINLQENTLIVLEPDQEKDSDSIRLVFSQGDLTSRSQRKLRVATQNWVLNTEKGSEINLRSTEDKKLIVEVAKGSVDLINKENKKTVSVKNNERAKINKEKIIEKKSISKELSWNQEKRIYYTHDNSKSILLSWFGEAKKIHYSRINGNSQKLLVDQKQQQALKLDIGQYRMHLENQDRISKTLLIEVRKAPQISLFSPLPRDRAKINTEKIFSWSPNNNFKNYRLEFSKHSDFKNISHHFDKTTTIRPINLNDAGKYYWRVIAIDENGNEALPNTHYPVYWLKNPLEAPQLIQPQEDIRQPANKKPNSSYWDFFMNLLIPKVHAEEALEDKEVKIRWQPVPEADFYILEISETSDFESLVVNTEVSTNSFDWKTQFNKEIYYMRVAGGSNDGRMGLFSEVQALDIKMLLAAKSLRTQPVQNAKVKSKKTESTTQKKKNENQDKKSGIYPHGELWVAYNYSLINARRNDDHDVSYSGGSLLKLNNLLKFNKVISTLDIEYMQIKPKSENSFPFQENLESWRANLSLYKKTEKSYFFGLNIRKQDAFERSGLESLRTKEQYGGGFSYLHKRDIKGWHMRGEANLYYIDSSYGLSYSNQIRKSVTIKGWEVYSGGTISGDFQKSSSYEQWLLGLGFIIGSEW